MAILSVWLAEGFPRTNAPKCYKKATHTNNFLSRYIQKETVHILGLSRGQVKKAQSIAAIVDEYSDQMPEESIKHGRALGAKMIEKIEKVANQ